MSSWISRLRRSSVGAPLVRARALPFSLRFNVPFNVPFNKEPLRGSASPAVTSFEPAPAHARRVGRGDDVGAEVVPPREPTLSRLTDSISACVPNVADPESGGSGRRWRQRVGTTNRPTFHPVELGVQRFVV
jgi:hypothetical protein